MSNKILSNTRLNGLGAPIVDSDFGGMNGIFDDIGTWASSTLEKAGTALQTSATKAVVQTVQNTVMKITGQDGKVASVTMTPAQVAAYNASGTLPTGVLPAGFVPQKSFMDQYGKTIMYAGLGLGGLVAIAIIVKMLRKPKA